ncbi:hypothetical protein H072_279 [Dactylellina haptotyla CBS 200.50]|uniref:CHAT domain-containing protein n=1 Tax=Dactylellina haptotyla (strain CBS 200.50) TaxID=1284197 RepID=S8CDZ3_DACHA|nr:hypothetical protein H072_279 [Dactylellina haptotyla CBS 200.50]
MQPFDIDPEITSSLDELDDEELENFAESQLEPQEQGPVNSKQVELYIYTCFLIFRKRHSPKYLEQAIHQTGGWIAKLGVDPDNERRLQILDFLSAWMIQSGFISATDTASPLLEDSQEIQPDFIPEMSIQIPEQHDVAIQLMRNYEQTGVLGTLNKAISIMQQNVELAGKYITPDILNDLGVMLGMRFERTGAMDDLSCAIEAANMAVNATPQDDPTWASCLNGLGNRLGRRYERTGSIDDINRAVEVASMALDATPQDHPNRASRLGNLGNLLEMRFEQTGSSSMEDINRAIEITDMALDLIPHDHPNRARYLNNLGNQLEARFNRTGSVNDLDRAVEAADMAVNATPQDHPFRAGRLGNLGTRLGTRFERTGSIEDLNRAIEIANIAINITPHDHPNRASYLNNLGNQFISRFEQTGSVEDLNRAIEVTDMAVNSTPPDHPNWSRYLHSFGISLRKRFERTGSMEDLNRSVEAADMAVNAVPQNHFNWSSRLNSLGVRLTARFGRTSSMNDLNRAIKAADMAVDSTPRDHPDRAVYLKNLGISLGTRYDRTGSIEDLNRAIEVTDMAVGATPQDHPDRAHHLDSLGHHLRKRFERSGSIDDIDRAVKAAEMAVEAIPQNNPSRAGLLSNLSNQLGTRFSRTKIVDDIKRAVEAADMAVNATPKDHPRRADHLNSLGLWLGRQYERTGVIEDINRAIEIANMAVNATPQDHPDRPRHLNNLAIWLQTRFDRTGSMDDLSSAIEAADMAVNIAPQDLPNRITYFYNLGNQLMNRFELIGSIDDLNRALSSYTEGWHCRSAPPSLRIQSAWKAADILAAQQDWETSSLLLEEAIKLFPVVSPRSLKHTDKQSMLAKFAGLASMAAALSLNAGRVNSALQTLELGRGVIAGLLMEMRVDISDLKHQHPDLANEFVFLRDALDSPEDRSKSSILSDNIPSMRSQKESQTEPQIELQIEPQKESRYELDRRLSGLIATIRSKPGFDNFLLPPTETEMKNAACFGPIVVINVSPYRCDAFLIERNQIRILELPNLIPKDAHSKARDLPVHPNASFLVTETLEWLWDVLCRPILDALGFKHAISDDNWPRIWWIPTGLLSKLPLHAAGYHEQGETVLDRVMSSYASSIKALIYGRQHHVQSLTGPGNNRALLVAMKQTPDLGVANQFLPFVEDEVNMLKELCPSLQLEPIIPTLQKDDVLKQMQECKLFHFAGHGSSHPTEPSQSYLLLKDWKINPLTVGDIRDCNFQEKPFLGYLSACLTGANEAEELADEGIHLVSSFQLAGFRHVIGALWEVSDEQCVDVARIFYETIRDEGMTDEAVCRGLHRALRSLRGRDIGEVEARNAKSWNVAGSMNLHWAPYIHFGV